VFFFSLISVYCGFLLPKFVTCTFGDADLATISPSFNYCGRDCSDLLMQNITVNEFTTTCVVSNLREKLEKCLKDNFRSLDFPKDQVVIFIAAK
jgi:hypothetical protein